MLSIKFLQFSFGSGGGFYSAEDEIYTENIEFFSRNNKSVGRVLPFQYSLKDNDWHQVYLTRAEKEQSEGSKNCLHRMSFADDAQRSKVENHG